MREIKLIDLKILDHKLKIPLESRKIYKNFEPITTDIIMRNVNENSHFIDVGANFGYFTLLAAQLIKKGKIWSIEANPEIIPILRLNTEAFKNLKIINKAVGSENKKIEFYLADDFVNSSVHQNLYCSEKKITVEMIKLDDLIGDQSVDFIKVDVQGDEISILEGARKIIDREKNIKIIIEWAPGWIKNSCHDPFSLPEVLSNMGFKKIEIIDEYSAEIMEVERMMEILKKDNLGKRFCNIFASK